MYLTVILGTTFVRPIKQSCQQEASSNVLSFLVPTNCSPLEREVYNCFRLPNKKSQNCVKAAKAFVCTTCKRQLLFALLQLITIVCPSAIENILCTTVIVNFRMH